MNIEDLWYFVDYSIIADALCIAYKMAVRISSVILVEPIFESAMTILPIK
jgi:hypothetical protein